MLGKKWRPEFWLLRFHATDEVYLGQKGLEMNYILDTHSHTLASGHSYSTIREMALAAAERGLELLGITEHAPKMPGSCHELYFSNLRVVQRNMCGVELLLGAELNILDFNGRVDLPQSALEKLDITIASMHPPCIRFGTKEQNTAAYLKAMENPFINIIGHPDDTRYPVDFEALVLGAKEHHVLLELNDTSLSPNSSRRDPIENDIRMLEACRRYNVPIVVGSDAHIDSAVGNHEFAEKLLSEMDFPEELVVNRSVEELKSFVNKYKISRL